MINKDPVHYVSTDLLAPDYKSLGKLLVDLKSHSKWDESRKYGQIDFGALYLEMTYSGEAEITIGSQTFSVNNQNGLDAGDGYRRICFQLLLYKEQPIAGIKAKSLDFDVRDSRLRLIKY